MNHEDYKEMLELEALGMLEEAEVLSLHEHLATCAECRGELGALSDTAVALLQPLPPVVPSPQVRERLLESIAAEAQAARTETTIESDNTKTGGTTQATPFMQPQQSRDSVQSFGVRLFMHRWGALAASIVIAVLLVLLVVLWNRNRAMQTELVRLARHNEEMQAELTRLSQRSEELQAELARFSPHDPAAPRAEITPFPRPINRSTDGATGWQIATASPTPADAPTPDVAPSVNPSPVVPEAVTRVVELAGTKEAPQARARLALNDGTGAMTFSVSGMPPAPVGKAYQLWFNVKGRFVAGPVFTTGPQGHASMSGQIPVAARNASIYVVTLENSTGANKPTGAKYLLSDAS